MKVLRKIARMIFPAAPPDISGPFRCPVCKTEGVGMAPLPMWYIVENHKHQTVHNPFFAETINFEHYSCLKCKASDRERLYALYMEAVLRAAENFEVLDIAPAVALTAFVKSFPGVQYRSMDLMMKGVDDQMDITDMHQYKDGQFNFLICSHVLEHVSDDRKAMRELYRVLRPGGQGIIMVPLNLNLEKTMEDPTHVSAADRIRFYGQDDHVRMYGRSDFVTRLVDTGFRVEQLDITHFGSEVFKSSAIFPTSVLYVGTKPA